jgi:hypothetical protein
MNQQRGHAPRRDEGIMAIFDAGQRKLLAGVVIGVAVSWAARELLAPFGQALRPLAKASIKSGLMAAERGREAVARLSETVDDLVAEVKAERAVDDLTASASAETWRAPAQES